VGSRDVPWQTALTVGDLIGLRKDEDSDGWSFVAAEMRYKTARSLRTLAANLATAGALCATWTRGHNVGFDVGWSDARYHCLGMNLMEPSDDWRPGCGRPMPGWGG
jgi:hypothetical protein